MIKSLALAVVALGGVAFTSCEDMLTKDSDYYLYADKDHLSSAADTVNSVLGIVNKLQAIAVRTNLLGEVRADLVTLNSVADIHLRELAENNISDNNKYNAPRDYYAIINNCNYFLAHANANLVNVAKDTIFRKEIDAVRVYRAWTYLQLAMNYDKVPLITEPILSEAEAEEWEKQPRKSFLEICDYFINDLATNYKSDEFPNYGRIDDNRLNPYIIFFPRLVVLGDLYLWRNALTGNPEDARQAALCYYNWIAKRDMPGRQNFLLSNTSNYARWHSSCFLDGKYDLTNRYNTYGSVASYGGEYITCIPMDSAANQSNYNQLRVLYNSRLDNNFQAAITPSEALRTISNSQVYCGYSEDQQTAYYPTVEDIPTEGWNSSTDVTMLVGDLRFINMVSLQTGRVIIRDSETGSNTIKNVDAYQTIYKQLYADICVYTVGMLYLRLAEAMNAAGYPAFASTILTWGLGKYSIDKGVLPYCTNASDSAFIARFSFPNELCPVYDYNNTLFEEAKQIGIHSRGSGNTYRNEKYYHSAYSDAPKYEPYKYTEADSLDIVEKNPGSSKTVIATKLKAFCDSIDAARAPLFRTQYVLPYYNNVIAKEQNLVDSLLQVEWALEECFDGTRFYNLMRADMRYRTQGLGWTAYPLSVAVSRRNPSVGELLKDDNNWYLKWQGKIGR